MQHLFFSKYCLYCIVLYCIVCLLQIYANGLLLGDSEVQMNLFQLFSLSFKKGDYTQL